MIRQKYCNAGDNIEMIAFQGKKYTSLKDLLPAASPASPRESWREIPIKDPLLQHAAWAYLQPVAAAAHDGGGDGWWWRRLQKRLLGCFNDVVLVVFEGWFPEKVRSEGLAVGYDKV